MKIESYIKQCQQRVNNVLKKKLPSIKLEPRELHQAMRYSVLNGGKRLRSAFVYATGDALGAKRSVLDDIAAAIEMIHAFTLIHDDLPALDNDALRRGKPTCHITFGEATAILAGDALQTLAFEILSRQNSKVLPPAIALNMINLLAQAVGSNGVIGGEELDLKMVNKKVTLKKLEVMYKLKTERLFKASIVLAFFASKNKNQQILHHLTEFSESIGLAFQIHDDIIGIESDTKTLGKQQGNDLALGKPVYPAVVGIAAAKQKERRLYQKALAHLDKAKMNTDKLRGLAAYLIERVY